MSKRAIYLDERERDLARRCFRIVASKVRDANIGDFGKLASSWTAKEIDALAAKFVEPEA